MRTFFELKRLGAMAAVALLASLTIIAPADAHRRNFAHNHNGAVAAGVAGLIIGGIIAGSNRGRIVVRRDHCHGRYCHRHDYNRQHYHHRSGAIRYQRPDRVRRNQRVVRSNGLSGRHYRWCDAKYRSYRARDNSFQPYRGGRKACVSPYY